MQIHARRSRMTNRREFVIGRLRMAWPVVAACAAAGGIASAMLLWYMWRNWYVSYTPIVCEWRSGEPVFVDRPDLLSEAHVERMRALLESYGEPYRFKGDELQIHISLAMNDEIVWNYCQKSGLGK